MGIFFRFRNLFPFRASQRCTYRNPRSFEFSPMEVLIHVPQARLRAARLRDSVYDSHPGAGRDPVCHRHHAHVRRLRLYPQRRRRGTAHRRQRPQRRPADRPQARQHLAQGAGGSHRQDRLGVRPLREVHRRHHRRQPARHGVLQRRLRQLPHRRGHRLFHHRAAEQRHGADRHQPDRQLVLCLLRRPQSVRLRVRQAGAAGQRLRR